MKLPQECLRAMQYGARYISVTMPWRSDHSLTNADFFYGFDALGSADSCYWQTPEGDMELLGIGNALSFALHSLDDLRSFQTAAREHVYELYLDERTAHPCDNTAAHTLDKIDTDALSHIHSGGISFSGNGPCSGDGDADFFGASWGDGDDTFMGAGFIALGAALSSDNSHNAGNSVAPETGRDANQYSERSNGRDGERRRTWGQLSEGYFFVPSILIRRYSTSYTGRRHTAPNSNSAASQHNSCAQPTLAAQHTITLNIEADSVEELSQRWEILTDYVRQLSHHAYSKTSLNDPTDSTPTLSNQPDAVISLCHESGSLSSLQENHLTAVTDRSSSETFTRERWAHAIASITSEFGHPDKSKFRHPAVNPLQSSLALQSSLGDAAQAPEPPTSHNTLKKVVLSRRLHITASEPINPHAVLSRLQNQQPHTYSFMLTAGAHSFISTTPERLLWANSTELHSASIAGSAPRGQTSAEDEQLGAQLLNDAKNVYEHQVVVDYIADELDFFIEGTPRTSERHILKNRDIQHLEILVSGTRRPDTRMIDALAALHPTPALGGMPTQRALEIQQELEPVHRGLYGGPIGWISLTRDVGEFAVGIRSGLIHGCDAYIYAGCGIVPGSDDEEEWQETARKFRPMLRGIHNV